MQIRLNAEIRDRAASCAHAMDADLKHFFVSAVGFYRAGKLDDVALDENLITATRDDSTSITFDEVYFPADEARRALALAIVFAEARAIKPFVTDLKQGVKGDVKGDYILG